MKTFTRTEISKQAAQFAPQILRGLAEARRADGILDPLICDDVYGECLQSDDAKRSAAIRASYVKAEHDLTSYLEEVMSDYFADKIYEAELA